ncbi:MAG: hypoxanthine phosphoribosyltransferase [Bacteroides sp.]|nr:hypoxanthine phosphoribosyltransferase [Bacteroides sp.]MDE6043052.1 hypoxanthine phosphoribosyltransferase [Muribaculaceae bacterium]
MKEVTCEGHTFVPYISRDQIDARIKELGKQIVCDYAGKAPLFICVLNGAFPFASDLFRAAEGIDAQITFIRLKSYAGMGSTGTIKEVIGLQEDVKGRNVIVIEDIIDTGHTIAHLLRGLKEKGAADIKVASLLFKPEALEEPDVNPDYVGFSIPKKFIIGFGLDLNEKARDLNDIYVLKDQA